MKNTVFLLTILIFSSCTKSTDEPFNKDIWQASSHCKPIKLASKRQLMLSSVTKLLPGKSQQEIEELLGSSLPDKVLPNEKRDLLYCLGSSGFGMSMKWLAIDLDEKGNFSSYKVLSGD